MDQLNELLLDPHSDEVLARSILLDWSKSLDLFLL